MTTPKRPINDLPAAAIVAIFAVVVAMAIVFLVTR